MKGKEGLRTLLIQEVYLFYLRSGDSVETIRRQREDSVFRGFPHLARVTQGRNVTKETAGFLGFWPSARRWLFLLRLRGNLGVDKGGAGEQKSC